MPKSEQPEYLDPDHEAIVTFASNYLDEDERDEFVDGLLERRGYRRVSSWAPPEAEEDEEEQPKKLLKPKTSAPREQAPAAGRKSYFKR